MTALCPELWTTYCCLPPFWRLRRQAADFEYRLYDLRQTLTKLLQDHLLSLRQSAPFLLGLFSLGQEAAACGFHHVKRDARQWTPINTQSHGDRDKQDSASTWQEAEELKNERHQMTWGAYQHD